MDYKKIIGELNLRFKYNNWFIRVDLNEENKIIIYIDNNEFFEKHIVKQIMSQYDCEYEICHCK